MNVKSFTLVANTGQVALTGAYVIRNIVYTNGAAGTLSAYDNSADATTQSNQAYVDGTRTNPYSRTTEATDVAGNERTYTYTGISDAEETVEADATYPLPTLVSLATPAAGQADSGPLFAITTKGLMLKSTVNATAVVSYEPAR